MKKYNQQESDESDVVPPIRLNYKFQRLAQKIKQAIERGELSGKLPGERELARRFGANAKTLSKALTDLAAEGLLQRSIGRGTFVKGSVPSPSNQDRWLVLCDAGAEPSPIVREIMAINPLAQVSTEDPLTMRPSFINSFSAVIDLSTDAPDDFVRDLLVRGVPVVSLARQPRTYSTHAVMMDAIHGLSRLARELMLAGHRRFFAIESRGNHAVSSLLRSLAAQYAPDASIDSCADVEAAMLSQHAPLAAVCESPQAADSVRRTLENQGINIPGQVAICAAGCIDGEPPCSGWFVTPREIARRVAEILRDTQPRRPATIWLTGQFIDIGTTDIQGIEPQPTPRLTGAIAN